MDKGEKGCPGPTRGHEIQKVTVMSKKVVSFLRKKWG